MISKKASDELLQDPNIVALWTNGEGRLVVGFKEEPLTKVVATIEGMSTTQEVVGEIKALQSRKDKWRPAPGGVSIGHYSITAGTLGGIAKKDGVRMILSNNHVLADSNKAKIGDEIHQPGPLDQGGGNGNGGPCPWARIYAAPGNFLAKLLKRRTRLKPIRGEDFLIAHLADFIPIDFGGGYNKVDCALGRPIRDDIVLDAILDIGGVQSFGDVNINDTVIKSGRTTGLTTGTVTATDGVIKVSYGGGLSATFENQIVTNNMLDGGDSGSWLVKDNALVGLCFAGSSRTSIMNKSSDVREALRIQL